jgi:site-specific recombinase XerD
MANRHKVAKRSKPKTILGLPDLEQSKHAVLNSLAAASSQESYGHAIDEFIGWYCSEPRLAFNRTVVLRYRFFLEQKNLAPSTINVRLAAVRRLAYEASDTGLLSPDLAAGIRRVKGAKRLGVRIGNWLTIEQVRALLQQSPSDALQAKRDRAILAVLVGCGLRRAELIALKAADFQVREEHWVIADLIGKGKHIRTVPVPAWVKRAVDTWTAAAEISAGTIFRRVNRLGKPWGDGITPKAIWHVVKGAAQRAGIANLAPHDLRRTCARGRLAAALRQFAGHRRGAVQHPHGAAKPPASHYPVILSGHWICHPDSSDPHRSRTAAASRRARGGCPVERARSAGERPDTGVFGGGYARRLRAPAGVAGQLDLPHHSNRWRPRVSEGWTACVAGPLGGSGLRRCRRSLFLDWAVAAWARWRAQHLARSDEADVRFEEATPPAVQTLGLTFEPTTRT